LEYIAQSIANPALEARTSITIDIITPPVPLDDVITLSPWQFEQSTEVMLDTLLRNDVDPNSGRLNTLPLSIESASCELRGQQCTIEDGTQVRIQLQGNEVSSCLHSSTTTSRLTSTQLSMIRLMVCCRYYQGVT
jgi:hypothetical protein